MAGGGNLKPEEATAYAEVLSMAAVLSDALNDRYRDIMAAHAKQREEQRIRAEEDRKRREEEREAARQEREARIRAQYARLEPLVETLKWRLGDQVRLRRDHANYKSTVFGTIEKLDFGTYDGHFMDITTERGKFMRIRLRDVSSLEIREPGQKRYEEIYTYTPPTTF